MSEYRFTIITVCYNAELYIEKTVKSLLTQTYENYEYIIKDGRSTDRTLKIIEKQIPGNDRIRVISENDKGIYDAMNYAVGQAKGEYVFFLNAGDCFSDEHVLMRVNDFLNKRHGDIFYGDIMMIGQCREQIRRYKKICSEKLYFVTGDCICHQAIFARRALFELKKFNTEYKVCADKEWQLYWIDHGAVFHNMGFLICRFLTEGFSKLHVEDFEKETLQCLKQYCCGTAWIYRLLLQVKKNKTMLRVLKALEKLLFVKGQES